MKDLIIIGGGTAGLTAALYGARAGLDVLVLEENFCGGQIVNAPHVENFPGFEDISGAEIAERLQKQAERHGAEIAYRVADKLERQGDGWQVISDGEALACRAVILATGAKNRPLGLADEERFVGAGVSYCATCDGALFKGKSVAVVGGGNTALEDALFLSAYCARVDVVHRRDAFRGDRHTEEALRGRQNVFYHMNTRVDRLEGERSLSAIALVDTVTGRTETLPVEGLFVAIGQMPANARFAPPVTLDAGGYIEAGEDTRTAVPGVFAAGDCRVKTVRQLATAAADGAVAGLAATAYIRQSR